MHGRDPNLPTASTSTWTSSSASSRCTSPATAAVREGVRHRLARRVCPCTARVPDGLGRWRRRARRVALAAIAPERPDALVSFGMPMTDHLLGLDLKRATGLPWLAHFSDPWAGNPHHPRSGWCTRPTPGWRGGSSPRLTGCCSPRTAPGDGDGRVSARVACQGACCRTPGTWNTSTPSRVRTSSPVGFGLAQRGASHRRLLRDPVAEPLFAALALMLRRDPVRWTGSGSSSSVRCLPRSWSRRRTSRCRRAGHGAPAGAVRRVAARDA